MNSKSKIFQVETVVHTPGTHYYYNGGNTNLLGEIIEKVSGIPLDQFAAWELFEPLGIEQYEWMHINSDVVYASGDLKLRPRDMAKLGCLMLNEGQWKGKQIVTSDWVYASAQPYVRFNDREGYGYQWWTKNYTVGKTSTPSFSANGWGGQQIIVLPDLETIVIFTGGNYLTPVPND